MKDLAYYPCLGYWVNQTDMARVLGSSTLAKAFFNCDEYYEYDEKLGKFVRVEIQSVNYNTGREVLIVDFDNSKDLHDLHSSHVTTIS